MDIFIFKSAVESVPISDIDSGDSGMDLFKIFFGDEVGRSIREDVRPRSTWSLCGNGAVLPKCGVVIVVGVVFSNVAGSFGKSVPKQAGFFVRKVKRVPRVVAHKAGAGGWGLSNWLTVQKMPTQG